MEKNYDYYDNLIIGDVVNNKTVVKIKREKDIDSHKEIKVIIFNDKSEAWLSDGIASFSEEENEK